MKLTHTKKNSGFTLVELLVVIAIIAGLAAISSPIIIRQIAKSRATTALNNSKDIYVGLREYALANAGAAPYNTGDANVNLRLLFSTGKVTDEKPFFVKGTSYTGAAEGDGNTTTTAAIAAGENVFSYYTDGTAAINILKAPANTPILSCPAQNAANIYTGVFFTPDFGAQAVVLRTDGSAVVFPVTEGTTPGQGTLSDTTGTDLTAPTGTGVDTFTTIVNKLPTAVSSS